MAVIGIGFFAWRAHDVEQRRLAEGRQSALEKVQLEAMNGNFEEADRAIAEAERFGASLGDVRMLKGQIALHRGDAKTAVAELERAVYLMPRSVAARALLGIAHFENNEVGTAFTVDQTELAKLEPSSAEDYHFMGRFEALNDPHRGLTLLNEAVRRRDSPVMRLSRAEVLALRALDTWEPEDAADAVKDAIFAREFLPDNAAVTSLNLFAQLVKARVCREQAPQQAVEALAQAERDSEALAQAGRDSEALARGPASFNKMTLWRHCLYLDYADKKDECLELASRERAVGNDAADLICAVILAEQNDYAGCLNVLKPTSIQTFYLTSRAFALAMQPDAPARVRAGYDQAASLPRSDTYVDLYPQTILRLLGPNYKQEAMQVCREISERRSHWPPARRAWYLKLLDYNCGFCSAQELLDEAKGSRWNQCEAHFFIAMTCLADGDSYGARQHFKASFDTDVFSFNEQYWSRLFLARMRKDETWPPWIPVGDN